MELLERTPYLTKLHGLLRQAADGQGSLVFLGGEAGVGKTTLVRRVGTELSGNARLLVGACDPLTTPRPLGPLLDIATTVGGALGRLATTSTPRHHLFSAFLVELSRESSTTVAVFEDVHWADEATLDLLRYLGRRIGSTRAVLIATYRDDEVGPRHPLQVVLGDLATAGDVCQIALSPLSVDGVRALAGRSSLDPVELHRQTGGNPFFVTEVLAAGSPGIPATVRDAVLARAARLSATAREVLDGAAVIGPPVEPLLLMDVIDATDAAIEECLALGLLTASGATLAFRHELARLAILEAMSLPRRIALHARVLAGLRAAPAPDLARLAHHAEAAADPEAVLAYAPAAAERAAAMRAHREAAAQYARALRFAQGLPPGRRGELLQARSYECYLTDEISEAIDACQAALDIWRQLGDTVRIGDTYRRLSRLYWLDGRKEDAERAVRMALVTLEAVPPGPPLAMAYSTLSQLHLLAWEVEEATAWANRAIALAESLGERETLSHALNNAGMGLLGTGDERGEALVKRSLHLALDADLEEHAARAFSNLGVSHAVRYGFGQADAVLLEGIAYCAERDLEQQRLYMLAWRAISLLHQGRWAEAAATAGEVVRQPHLSPTSRIMALVALGRVRVRRGDVDAAATLEEAFELAERTGELQRIGPVRIARAEAAWLAGDVDQVIAETRGLLERVVRHNHQWLVGELAYWLWRAGECATAPPGTLEPFALQIAGKWNEASARWRTLGCPYEAAWALADGHESALRDAHAQFLRLNAIPAAEIVARRLREMGASGLPRGPRPATRANPAQLTARELEILTLLAEGLSNTEIARRLYLSPRTVAHHVSAVLAKLGVHSRAAAVQEASRRGISSQNGQGAPPK